MRRVLGYLTIWCGATALAISLAWFGVRDVLRAEVTDEPYPGVAVAAARTGRPPAPTPAATPAPTPSARTPATATPTRRATGRGPSTAPVTTKPPATAAATRSSPTRRPTASRPPRKPTTSPKPSRSPTRTASAPNRSSQVKVVTVKSGQVSFDTGNGECRLLSATPRAGYEAKVSGNVGWIRVDLMQGEHGSSVFCTWHGHAPMTDVWEF